jgi:hypothetical protein
MIRYQDIVTTKLGGEMPSFLILHQFDGVLAAPSKTPAPEAPRTHADKGVLQIRRRPTFRE